MGKESMNISNINETNNLNKEGLSKHDEFIKDIKSQIKDLASEIAYTRFAQGISAGILTYSIMDNDMSGIISSILLLVGTEWLKKSDIKESRKEILESVKEKLDKLTKKPEENLNS